MNIHILSLTLLPVEKTAALKKANALSTVPWLGATEKGDQEVQLRLSVRKKVAVC